MFVISGVRSQYRESTVIVYCLKKSGVEFSGIESFSSLAPKIWELIAQSLKGETELSHFKTKIETRTTS